MTSGPRAGRWTSPDGLRANAELTRHRLEARRSTSRAVDAVFRSVQLHTEAGGGLLAGAIAFRFFLFLVPGTFLVVMGLGFSADAAGTDPQEVARQFGIAGLAATAITSGAEASTVTRWVTFGVALVAFVLASRNLLKALLIAHALIWRVPVGRSRRPFLTALCLLSTVLLAIVLLLLTYRLRSLSLVGSIVGLALYTLVPAGLWLFASLRLFPAGNGVTWRDVLPGAALFGAGAEALHLVTVLWIAPTMESKSQTYGAMGAALALLLWAYLLGQLVTSSAALNAALWRLPRDRPGASSAAYEAAPVAEAADSEPGAR